MRSIASLCSVGLAVGLSIVVAVGLGACEAGELPPDLEAGRDLAAQAAADLAGQPDDLALGISSQILLTLDDGAVTVAQLARRYAGRAEVLAYAQRMVAAHAAHFEAVARFDGERGIVPQDGRVTAVLRDDREDDVAFLETHRPIDVAYMSNQVRTHEAALRIVAALVEAHRDPAFRGVLADTQDLLGEHLADAEAILRGL
ncbi:MAG: DUF4142 domain-containing protein [Deltaproteobacteria bacterium]|nr:DUF4142 domain-containing protein [Deltaproteobacteria bacterium]